MRPASALRRAAAPVASALMTAMMLTAGLAFQRARSAWPFVAGGAVHVAEPPATAAEPSPQTLPTRVPIDVASIRGLEIRLETVAPGPISETLRAVATIVPDESRISHVHSRVAGWIETLDVNTTWESVKAGQALACIFSQELVASQTEYLAARANLAASGMTSAVLGSGRMRLGVLGMSPEAIDAIEKSGQPSRLVTVFAPRDGVVISRGVTVGTSVDPSTTLLTIADLSRVWILAEIPEPDIPAVRVGTMARLDFPASGRAPFTGRVDFIYPTLTERTRTLRARLSVTNPGGALRPGLYGTASFQSAGHDLITVPRDAVVDTGFEQHVFVAAGDRLEPRTITAGTRFGDRIEIRDGLRAGEQIVATGVFLLDSESRLRATSSAGHVHGPVRTDATEPGASSHAGHRR